MDAIERSLELVVYVSDWSTGMIRVVDQEAVSALRFRTRLRLKDE